MSLVKKILPFPLLAASLGWREIFVLYTPSIWFYYMKINEIDRDNTIILEVW
jgi:hypothetical protein